MRSAFWGALGVAALAITPVLAQSDSDGLFDSVPKIEPGEVIDLDPGAGAGEEIGKYRFVLDFQPAKDRETTLIKTLLEREGVFERVLDSLSDQIALPQDVPVVFEHCEAPNGYWDPAAQRITMCYEFVANFYQDNTQLKDGFAPLFTWADPNEVMIGTTMFVLLHEIGHGMVSLFQLPITGREEDVVDQFALFILANSDEDDQPISERPSRLGLLAANSMLAREFPIERAPRSVWADTHSLAPQRGIDQLCMVIGGAPDAYFPYVLPGYVMARNYAEKRGDALSTEALIDMLNKSDDLNLIPWQRGEHCPSLFAKSEASWDYLIEAFMTPKSN